MNATSSLIRHLKLSLLVAVLAAGGSTGTVHAAERVAIPDESPGPPFYMRWLTADDHECVVNINIFYRSPACVPADFSLLDFVDIPRAFRCTLTVEGFEVRTQPFGPPVQSELHGLGAVPFVFVKRTELEAAAADGEMTLAELLGLASAVTGARAVVSHYPPARAGEVFAFAHALSSS